MRGYRSCVYSAMREMIHTLRSTNKKNILVYSVMAVLMASLSTWMLFLTPGAMYVGTEFKGGQIVLCSTLIIAFGLILMYNLEFNALFKTNPNKHRICNCLHSDFYHKLLRLSFICDKRYGC